MKLLLDENLPHALRHQLPGHVVFTVTYMGWIGIENGDLLALAGANGFDAMLTMDSGIPHHHDVAALPCSLVLISAHSNTMFHLEPLVPKMLQAISQLMPKSIARVQ